jgi:hypothetical protein
MRKYFISFSFVYRSGKIGFTWTEIQRETPIDTSEKLKALERLIVKQLHERPESDPLRQVEEVTIMNWRLMEAL